MRRKRTTDSSGNGRYDQYSTFRSDEFGESVKHSNNTAKTGGPSWRSLFFFMTKSNLPVLIAGIFASLVAGAVSPAQSYLTGRVFDRFTAFAAGELQQDEFMRQEKNFVLYLLIASGVSWVALFLELALWITFGELQAKSARDRLFYGLLKKEMAWYDLRQHGIGALLPRMQAQIRALQLATSQPLGVLVSTLSTAVLSLIQAFVLSWQLTLVTLSTVPAILLAVVWIGRGVPRAFEEQDKELTLALKHATTAFSAIETVKCFNAQEIELRKYTASIAGAARYYYRATNANAMQMALITLLSVSMFVQGFYYGGILIANGKASTADVITTFVSAISAFQAINAILPQLIVLERGRNAGTTLRAIMADMRSDTEHPSLSGKRVPQVCKGHVEVKEITFYYPSRPGMLALHGVSVSIPAGETTFLIGKSGSGKSTLAQLLLKFYQAQSGTILIDGDDIATLDDNWLRKNITLVEQTSTLFDDSVANNIALGTGNSDLSTPEDISGAIQFALLQDTIHDMPDGSQTFLGSKGTNLSGGQRQRLALARAWIRDTPILILDESTSALDRINRGLMMDAIRYWRRGNTTIIVTHDISQILPEDYAYILQDAKVVQGGYRKDMEKTLDSPFQSFLSAPIAQDDTLYNIPPERHSELVPGRSMNMGHVENCFIKDVGQRKSIFRAVQNEASPRIAMPMRSGFGAAFTRHSMFSPNACQLTDAIYGTRDTFAEAVLSPGAVGAQRNSKALNQFVEHSGKLAADARMSSVRSSQRRTALSDRSSRISKTTTEPELMSDLDGSLEHRSPNHKLHRIMATLWPSIDWRTRVILILAIGGATVHAISIPVFSFILSKMLRLYAIPGGDKKASLKYAMIILGIAIVDAASTYIFHFFFEYCGQRWIDAVRAKAVAKVLDQPRAFFDHEENSTSRLTGCIDRNADEMRNLLGRFTSLVGIAFLMCTISVIWAVFTQWKMALIATATAPYMLGVAKAFGMISEKWEKASNDATEEAVDVFTETFTNIKTVRALTLEHHFVRKYTQATDHVLKIGFQRALFAGFFFGLSDSAGNFSIAMIYYTGARLVTDGVPAEHIVRVFVFLVFAITNLNAILEYIPQITTSKDLASRLLRLAQLPKCSHEHRGDVKISAVGEIMFNKVDYAYPSRPDQRILSRLNLAIKPGTCTAIVGGSGSGKSTIANLVLKLYDTRTTSDKYDDRFKVIAIASRSIERIDTRKLRGLIVPVSQTPVLFPASVSENIAYGLRDFARVDKVQEIMIAARKAGIHDFITSLPQGYNTLIGEGGCGISGGQAQRIAIARALVRKPAVLILDEATSALDTESARLVRQTIVNLRKDNGSEGKMTVIIITHAQEMMEIAENVVVLERGKIVESGAFKDLLRNPFGALTKLLSGGEWVGGPSNDSNHIE